jgi:hypothetical protein
VDWDGPIHGARPSGRQQVPRSAAHARSHGGTARVGATPTHVGCSPRVVVVPLGLGRRRLGAARCEKAMARASERSAAQRNVVVAATVSAEHVKSSCPRGDTPPCFGVPPSQCRCRELFVSARQIIPGLGWTWTREFHPKSIRSSKTPCHVAFGFPPLSNEY